MSLRSQTVFASAARTSTATSNEQIGNGRRGARFTLDVTAASGTTPTLDVKIQAKDQISGGFVDLPGLAFAQQTTTGTNQLVVYPGIAETANVSVSDVMPEVYQAVATIGGTTPSFTFTLSAELYD